MSGESDDALENLEIDGATLVTKEVNSGAKELAATAHALYAKGSYDLVVALVDNPIAANLVFNKYDDMPSAVCQDAEDAKNAKDNGVVALVIKQTGVKQLNDIIATFGKGGLSRLRPRMPSMPRAAPAVEQPQPQQNSKPFTLKAPKLFDSKPRQQRPPEPETRLPKRPGIGGWIKDELGIIDEDKTKKEKPKK